MRAACVSRCVFTRPVDRKHNYHRQVGAVIKAVINFGVVSRALLPHLMVMPMWYKNKTKIQL